MADYIVKYVILNFKTPERELDFGDFKIISVRQGKEAAGYRKELNCKIVPRHILIKEFPDYEMLPGDLTGFDRIIDSMKDLLLLFRLYKLGDINFYDSLIKEKNTESGNIDLYNVGYPSAYRYNFETDEIKKFNSFRKEIMEKPGYKNKFLQFAINLFMVGMDNVLFYRVERMGRIVNYVTALESLFLIDDKKCFLRRIFAERISKFLGKDKIKDIAKSMYDERSKIVHGSYILRKDTECKDKKSKVEKFEQLIREIFIKIFNHDFLSKKELVVFMQNLYEIPKEALAIIETAQKKANKLLN